MVFSVLSALIMRPLLSFAFLMYAQTPFTASPRVPLPLPTIFASAAEYVTGLKTPLPAFFWAAATFLPDATRALDFHWPFARLPPTYFTFFAFFFFFFFFFFFAFFFFFFFGFFAAFLAFLAFGFFEAAFFGFLVFAAAAFAVRASTFVDFFAILFCTVASSTAIFGHCAGKTCTCLS